VKIVLLFILYPFKITAFSFRAGDISRLLTGCLSACHKQPHCHFFINSADITIFLPEFPLTGTKTIAYNFNSMLPNNILSPVKSFPKVFYINKYHLWCPASSVKIRTYIFTYSIVSIELQTISVILPAIDLNGRDRSDKPAIATAPGIPKTTELVWSCVMQKQFPRFFSA